MYLCLLGIKYQSIKARPTDHWRGPNAGTETGLVASITPVTALVRLSPSLVPRLSTLTSTMTLTLDFQGQILKKLYLRNGITDWHGTKGMWVDRMLHPCCDFQCSPHPWPWPWICKVKYWNCCISGMGGSTHLEWKGCELDIMLDAQSHEKKIGHRDCSPWAHRELTVTKMVTASRDLGRDWAVT